MNNSPFCFIYPDGINDFVLCDCFAKKRVAFFSSLVIEK